MTAYGADPAAWSYFSETLGLTEDLLPVISDPAVEPSPGSKLTAFDKTPSMVNGDGRGHGIRQWTQHRATPADIARWSKDDRHGICVIARRLRAIDIDVDDREKAWAVRGFVTEMTAKVGSPNPMVRQRINSGKMLVPFWYDGELPKRVLPVEGGIVEILGESQQFLLEGTHPSGARYEWDHTCDSDIPELDADALEALWDALVLVHGTGEPRIARTRRAGAGGDESKGLDEVGQWLLANWECHDVEDGRVYVECPFRGEHTTGDGGTGTAYFSAGSGGYEQGHWRCLHAHCEGRTDAEFLDATGYSLAQFADLGEAEDAGSDGDREGEAQSLAIVDGSLAPLSLKRDKKGIEPTADNMLKMLREPSWVGRVLALDTFANELMWCWPGEPCGEEQWRKFSDNDTFDVRVELEKRGTKPMSADLLRQAIYRAASLNEIDTAQAWLGRLVWDGVPRVDQFAVTAWGWAAGPYATAVSRYIWTGLAGRVLEPGCQCDMAPVLVGAQGAGKTQSIKAMVPSLDNYITLPLDAHDDDTARLLRGKLVGELEELRGLNTRAIEAIKAWVTKTHESWIVKYKEYESKLPRRLLFFGTTNDEEFLNDPTGERRFLPGLCGTMDIDWIKQWRDQLWAEGMALYLLDGVAWQDAMALAPAEHRAFKVTDAWEQPVARWLSAKPVSLAGEEMSPMERGYVAAHDALSGAVSVPSALHDRARIIRMGRVLASLGWRRKRHYVDGVRDWWFVYEGLGASS